MPFFFNLLAKQVLANQANNWIQLVFNDNLSHFWPLICVCTSLARELKENKKKKKGDRKQKSGHSLSEGHWGNNGGFIRGRKYNKISSKVI